MPDLVTKEEVKIYCDLPITETKYDQLIQLLINHYQDIVREYCDVDFQQADHTETYDGDGTSNLLLDHYPVVSVSSLAVDTIAITSDQYVIRTGEGEIQFIDGSAFSKDFQNVQITYRAGMSEVPQQVKFAIIDLVARKFKQVDKGRMGVSSESFGDQSITYQTEELTDDIKIILNRYRKPKV